MIINNLDHVFEDGKYKGKKVKDVIKKNKKNIFKLIKDGYVISDEILNQFNIKKEVKNVKIIHDTVFDKSSYLGVSKNDTTITENDDIEDTLDSDSDDKEFVLMGTLIDEIDIDKVGNNDIF